MRSVALFLESDDDGAALAESLALCAERGVGVAVLKVGASEAGARAAAAHTGSLAGDQRVFRALVEEAGGAWAEDFHDLLELARALAEPRGPAARLGRARDPDLLGRRFGGRRRPGALSSGWSCPPLSPQHVASGSPSCCPTRRRSPTRSTTRR